MHAMAMHRVCAFAARVLTAKRWNDPSGFSVGVGSEFKLPPTLKPETAQPSAGRVAAVSTSTRPAMASRAALLRIAMVVDPACVRAETQVSARAPRCTHARTGARDRARTRRDSNYVGISFEALAAVEQRCKWLGVPREAF